MCTQSLNCSKSKYLLFFSAQRVSRYAGTDVTPFSYISRERNLHPAELFSGFCLPADGEAGLFHFQQVHATKGNTLFFSNFTNKHFV
jgi:hypothetical protein